MLSNGGTKPRSSDSTPPTTAPIDGGPRKDLDTPPNQRPISDDECDGKKHTPSKRQRLASLTSKTKAKTKRLFKSDGAGAEDQSESDQGDPLGKIEHKPALNSGQLVKNKRISTGGTADKTLATLQTIGSTIIHPKTALKSKATRTTAGQLSKVDRPYLSKKADLEYLQAHDNLKRAESESSSRIGISDPDQNSVIDKHRDKIQEIEAQRESSLVAWTTSRHVRRVRVVPKQHILFPETEFFVERDHKGNYVRYDWLKWIGYNLIYYTQDFSAQYIDDFDELPFNVDSLRHYSERVVMASAPWQAWLMNVRSVSRWEDPKTTGKWLALYVFLWYTEHVMGFLWFYIIYIVLKERYQPTSVESIRDSRQRALDSRGTAWKLGELIDKHGSHDWLEPVMADIGPFVQLQVGDIANMLEVFSNFYHWKYPKKTIATLWFFASCLAVSLFANMDFCMQIVWFIAGGFFFLCWPIASLYPKYRYLVSPFKWVLWDIPTDAEWSFQYLRRQAQITREQLVQKKAEEGHIRELTNPNADGYTGRFIQIPKLRVGDNDSEEDADSDDDGWYSASSSTSVLEATDIRSFRARSAGVSGRLIIFSKGIRFVRSTKTKEMWIYDFLDLVEMRKIKGNRLSKVFTSPDQLEIKLVDGAKLQLEGMKEREEAFNSIIAFSSLQWQSLQIKADTNAQEV